MRLGKYFQRWKGIVLLTGFTIGILVLAAACTQTNPQTTTDLAQTATVTATPLAASAVSSGTLSGKVTNSLTNSGIAGAKIVTDPAIANQTITTDNGGSYSASLPVGVYKLSITGTGFTAGSDGGSIVAGQTLTKNIVLVPAGKVAVNAGAAQTADPGATVTLKSSVTPLDGSTVTTYMWTQVSGPATVIANDKTDTLTVTLPKATVYKAALLGNLELLDRLVIKGINPEALINAETTTYKVSVTTSSGTYSGTVAVTAKLPYDFTTGLTDVPIGVPVLANAKVQANYSWTLSVPTGSKAAIDDVGSRNPVFTPDMAGKYTLLDSVSKSTLDVYAGTWAGAITGQNAQGQPLAAGCTVCHDGKTAPNNFADWQKSGHSQILTRNINDPAGHWTLACAGCHSVGDSTVASVPNGGFDEAIAAEGWKAPAHGDPSNWTTMLAQDPKSAKLANIQCENCHGPNNTSLHANGTLDPARISLSADVCGSCHGEPPRHGLFQQWETSAHSNYATAIAESSSGSCAGCHTAQGFMTWIGSGDLSKQLQGKTGNITAPELAAIVTPDNAQPQTCTVCHDPHKQGFGTTNATVRITDNTGMLRAGFEATNVGKGAICMVCHNTRNGLHNDANPPTAYSAPHTPSQTDVLMGQNAYFVNTQRSPHGDLQDTCVTCHMEESPAPLDLSMAGAGANHSFAADIKMCSKCHSDKLDGTALQAGTKAKLDTVGTALTQYLSKKLPASFTVLEQTPHTYNTKSYDVLSDPTVISKDNIASIQPGEVHGQEGYILNFKNTVAVTYRPAGEQPHTVNAKSVQFALGNLTTDGKTQVIPMTDTLVKAGWNYYLVEGDGSEGIHNPAYINQVLDATLIALK